MFIYICHINKCYTRFVVIMPKSYYIKCLKNAHIQRIQMRFEIYSGEDKLQCILTFGSVLYSKKKKKHFVFSVFHFLITCWTSPFVLCGRKKSDWNNVMVNKLWHYDFFAPMAIFLLFLSKNLKAFNEIYALSKKIICQQDRRKNTLNSRDILWKQVLLYYTLLLVK